MTLAEPWPWWALVAALAGVAFLTWREYSRARISRQQRATLAALRAVTLLLLILFLMRPVAVSDGAPRGTVVPLLVDVSRSMRIADAGGRPRIQRAREVAARLAPALGREFTVETLGFGETLDPLDPQRAEAAAPRTDLSAALSAVADRYRGRGLAGIVVISDGADTGDGAVPAGIPPIYTIPVGSPRPLRDREVAALAIGDAPLSGSIVDLTATVVSHGFDRSPIEIRVLENGRPFAARRVQPAADGAPVQEVFQVPPPGESATIYTVEIPAAPDELVPENNARSVLVPPAGRRRRLLLVEGAPGFEHSFLKRAWTADPGLELDAVVRKGQNERGEDTFYIQASTDRAPSLASGFPVDRKTLFAYDAIVLANAGAGFFGRERGDLVEAFVGERGGGLLVLGARSFAPGGIGGTAIEYLLPVVLARCGGARRHAGRNRRRSQPCRPDGRRAEAPNPPPRDNPGGDRKAMGGRAGAGQRRDARHSASRRACPRRRWRVRQRLSPAARPAALRGGPHGGVWRRSDVALEDDAPDRGSPVRDVLAADRTLAGGIVTRPGHGGRHPGIGAAGNGDRGCHRARRRVRAGARRFRVGARAAGLAAAWRSSPPNRSMPRPRPGGRGSSRRRPAFMSSRSRPRAAPSGSAWRRATC